mmetsp:Transcript_116459/g.238230  ORF Transcript_116459/g.238230 Transcript_116459/m.238230 type:complete len:97 (+) Transcript_116459:1342-1632(+)
MRKGNRNILSHQNPKLLYLNPLLGQLGGGGNCVLRICLPRPCIPKQILPKTTAVVGLLHSDEQQWKAIFSRTCFIAALVVFTAIDVNNYFFVCDNN